MGDIITLPSSDKRRILSNNWGKEIVVECCRYWLLHNANGTWGNCGICRTRPRYTNLTWNQVINKEIDNG